MLHQITFSPLESANNGKLTRHDRFLAEMEPGVAPSEALLEGIRNSYYGEHNRGPGHPPIPLNRLLLSYFSRRRFALADEALEDDVYDSQTFHSFLSDGPLRSKVPDAITLVKLRRLLETNNRVLPLFERVNALLMERGRILTRDTLAAATIVGAPSSTKNAKTLCDPVLA
jgi:IS5 family transposase